MKWLHDNFVGMALLAAMAFLVLVSLALAVVWAWPVSTDLSDVTAEQSESADQLVAVSELGAVTDYAVINERPVFSMSRQPQAVESEDDVVVVEEEVTITGAPEVKLTGIFISPGVRIASLMPLQGEQVSVRAKEGDPLIGDYVGWEVSSVKPRHVVLTSRDGETLKLELKVHDVKIEEPPKVEEPTLAEAGLAAAGDGEVPVGEDGQPMSRAEQIRARIAERREELRRQQAGEQPDNEGETTAAAPPPDYQSAIRNLMNNRAKDNNGNDEKDS